MIVSRSTIFHEIGHVSGYILANKNQETFLGDYRLVFSERNYVEALSKMYVTESENRYENCQKIYNATSNIKRTVAYIIKTVLGCVFQSIIENCTFDDLWKLGKSGATDLGNLYTMRKSYAFNWNDMDIYNLQDELKSIIIRGDVLIKSTPLLDYLETILPKAQCVIFQGESLIELNSKIVEILDDIDIHYDSILYKWASEFSTRKQNNPCSILYPHIIH